MRLVRIDVAKYFLIIVFKSFLIPILSRLSRYIALCLRKRPVYKCRFYTITCGCKTCEYIELSKQNVQKRYADINDFAACVRAYFPGRFQMLSNRSDITQKNNRLLKRTFGTGTRVIFLPSPTLFWIHTFTSFIGNAKRSQRNASDSTLFIWNTVWERFVNFGQYSRRRILLLYTNETAWWNTCNIVWWKDGLRWRGV